MTFTQGTLFVLALRTVNAMHAKVRLVKSLQHSFDEKFLYSSSTINLYACSLYRKI